MARAAYDPKPFLNNQLIYDKNYNCLWMEALNNLKYVEKKENIRIKTKKFIRHKTERKRIEIFLTY